MGDAPVCTAAWPEESVDEAAAFDEAEAEFSGDEWP
jgi:hypothetical protein